MQSTYCAPNLGSLDEHVRKQMLAGADQKYYTAPPPTPTTPPPVATLTPPSTTKDQPPSSPKPSETSPAPEQPPSSKKADVEEDKTPEPAPAAPFNADMAKSVKINKTMVEEDLKKEVAKTNIGATMKPFPNFDAKADAQNCQKALKKLFTDHKTVISILCNRSRNQRILIRDQYKNLYGESMNHAVRAKLFTTALNRLLIAMCQTEGEFDANIMRAAMKGMGTKESVLIEIMTTRTNAQVKAMKEAYKEVFTGRDLEADVKSETSGNFQQFLVALLQAARDESDVVNADKAKADAQALLNAGEKKWGTDEGLFIKHMVSDNFKQLEATFNEYNKLAGKSIEISIQSEFSGDIRKALLTMVQIILDKVGFFAERLFKAMKGFGTTESILIRVIVSRSEIDLVQIKTSFNKSYKYALETKLKSETSGKFQSALLEIVRDRN